MKTMSFVCLLVFIIVRFVMISFVVDNCIMAMVTDFKVVKLAKVKRGHRAYIDNVIYA